MTYVVSKQGHDSWDDLKGQTISFEWSDGWDDYDPTLVFDHTEPYEEMGQERYYIMDTNGGGYSVWESAQVEVTVHESAAYTRWEGGNPELTQIEKDAIEDVRKRYRAPGGHLPNDHERAIIEERRRRRRDEEGPRARGGVDAWLDEQPEVSYTGGSDAARNAAIERAARFFGKRPWWLENMVDAILKAYKEAEAESER